MYLIVGLGNPEGEYSNTRHNMGFDAINHLSQKLNITVTKEKFKALYGDGMINNEKVILLKPQTYMNLSGESIVKVRDYFKIDNKNIIVIYDDIDLEPGIVKLRKKGGAGTHNGMKSVIASLQTKEFPHVRIGTGQPEFKELLVQHVIGKLSEDEYNALKPAIKKAADAVPIIIKDGIDNAMNKLN